MNIIFLDIDGVLNHSSDGIINGEWTLDNQIINKLYNICILYNIKLVISSSHRLNSVNKTIEFFNSNSLSILSNLIIGVTPIFADKIKYRYEEIKKWIEIFESKYNIVSKYCILDDFELNSSIYHIKTYNGLTNENFLNIIRYFN